MSLAPDASSDLERRVRKLGSILEVAKALTAERDLDRLLARILDEAARVADADRCSLFVLDRERGELWSKVAQGAEGVIRFSLDSGIAGSVARSGQSLSIPDAYSDPRFNRAVDVTTGYRTGSILCVPMTDAAGEVTGVLQALNKKGGGPFDGEDEELLRALGGQAAAAIENALLHEEINRLFEGFVKAAVLAIEQRDPSTAGHSNRVAALTVGLALAVERDGTGAYAGLRFTPRDLMEIRYASLLHDFGKVGVREHVLLKAEKLYPHELAALGARFALARKDRELESLRRRLAALRWRGTDAFATIEVEEDQRLARELGTLDEVLGFVRECNRPTVLRREGSERLRELEGLEYRDADGVRRPLLTEHERTVLAIPRGTLSASERTEIESHVTHTYNFLRQIPWSRALRNVPDIAYAHHEKLDGRGYPRSVPGTAIPVPSRMMAISDIYDALTASDRSYKKAVPHAVALDILAKEVEAGQLDAELFRVFVAAEVPRTALAAPGG